MVSPNLSTQDLVNTSVLWHHIHHYDVKDIDIFLVCFTDIRSRRKIFSIYISTWGIPSPTSKNCNIRNSAASLLIENHGYSKKILDTQTQDSLVLPSNYYVNFFSFLMNFLPEIFFQQDVLMKQYLHSDVLCLRWSIRKPLQIFSNERHQSHNQKIDNDFFYFYGLFAALALYINIRIEVHFFLLHWEMKGHWSRVNLWEALHKIYMWPVFFHFPMQ